MIEFDDFKNQWKPQLYAIQAVTSGDALSLMQHLLRRVHGTIVSYQPISVSKSVLSSLMGKHRNSIKKYFKELEDLNLVSEHPSIDGGYPVFLINWEEIAAINDVCKKLNYTGQAELRNLVRGKEIVPFSKLRKDDIDELLKKYSFNDNDYQDWKDAQNFSIPQKDDDAEIFSELCDLSGKAVQMLEESCTNFQHTCTKKQQGCTNFQHTCLKFQHTVENFSNIYDLLQHMFVQISETPEEIEENAKILEETCTKFQHLCTKFQHVFQKDAQNFSTVIKNNIENIKESRAEGPIEGENKEKLEEIESDGELPDNNKNSSDSFLENSLGESSSNNQGTSSDENILDSEPLMETSQEEEIKVQEIPDWEETRDSSYSSFPAMEINNIIRYPRDYQEDIHELIRRTFELFEGDACQEYEEETSQIPCRFFDRELKEIVEELKESNPEFSISSQDAKNIFFFEPVWNRENKEFDYEISTSSIHDITQAPRKAGKNRKSSDTKFTSIERYSYWEALDEVGDGDEKNLTPMEQAVYALKYDMEVDETRHSILGTSSDGQNYLFVEFLYDQQVVKWAEEAEVDVEEFKELLKVFKKQNNKVVIRPTRIDIGKIMDWNRQHSLESKVEILWKQKMAEPQN